MWPLRKNTRADPKARGRINFEPLPSAANARLLTIIPFAVLASLLYGTSTLRHDIARNKARHDNPEQQRAKPS
jgi:hypothetical protein